MLFSAGAGETPLPLETRIRERFDMILIDSPSVSEAPLVTSVGRFIDGVILVVEAEHHPLAGGAERQGRVRAPRRHCARGTS
jgi:hypothetical protein